MSLFDYISEDSFERIEYWTKKQTWPQTMEEKINEYFN